MFIRIEKSIVYLFSFILLCNLTAQATQDSPKEQKKLIKKELSSPQPKNITTRLNLPKDIPLPPKLQPEIKDNETAKSDDDDDFDFDFLDDITLDDLRKFEDENSLTRNPDAGMDIETILGFLGAALNNQPIWKKTQTPSARDILYHIPHKMAAIEYGGLAFIPFFNMTNKMDTSAESLIDLSAITQTFRTLLIDALLESIRCDGDNQDDGSAQEAASLIPLFQKMQIQERKLGLLIQGGFIRGPLTVQVQSSLQLGARNFWLSLRDQKAINDFILKEFGELPEGTNEFLIIKYGMGDTKIKIGLNTLNHPNIQADFGFESIAPTSNIATSSEFTNDGVTNFELDDLLSGTGFDLLRGVRDALLEPQLGNGGFWGFGPYFESKIGIFRDLAQLWIRLSYHKYFPGITNKLVMFKTTRPSTGFTEADDAGQFIREYLFPTLFKVRTSPGGIFNAIVSASINTKYWLVAFGYDFYAQQREIITELLNTSTKRTQLRLDNAEAEKRIQHKIFSEVTYRTRWKKTALDLGIGGDLTVASRNLGYDWTVYAKAALSF